MISTRTGVVLLAAGWIAIGLSPGTFAQTVTRGPYLQSLTPTSVIVRWRTDVATTTRVDTGPTTDSLSLSWSDTAQVSEHIAQLSGLEAETRYYYAIGKDDQILAGRDGNHYFITAPQPGTEKTTRIWVVADSGLNTERARAVRDAYSQFTADRPTDLWLLLGDNAYWSGTDEEYQANFFELYPEMLHHTAAWPAFGNHDGYSGADSQTQTGPYYDIFTLPTQGEAGGVPSGTEAYYSFDYGNVHFICLDSYDSDRSTTAPMLTWLTQDLADNTRRWTLAFWHYTPYTKGSYDSDSPTETRIREMRENALPILESGGVDVVLCGHSHVYERSFLINGHYGISTTLTPEMVLDGGDGKEAGDGVYRKPPQSPVPNAGTVYVVCGVASILRTGPLDHPIMVASMSRFGSVVVDIDQDRLDARFLDDAGVIADWFTILKRDPPPAGWVMR